MIRLPVDLRKVARAARGDRIAWPYGDGIYLPGSRTPDRCELQQSECHVRPKSVATNFPSAAHRRLTHCARIALGLAPVVPTLSGLVLFGTRDGVVGVGCLKELSEAQRAGVPVALLDHRCRPRTYGGRALLFSISIHSSVCACYSIVRATGRGVKNPNPRRRPPRASRKGGDPGGASASGYWRSCTPAGRRVARPPPAAVTRP